VVTVTTPPADPESPTSIRRLIRRLRGAPALRNRASVVRGGAIIGAVVLALVSLVGTFGPGGDSATAAPGDEAEPGVVFVGISGLGWSDVTAEDTPTLYSLTGDDAAASLTVRTVRSRTCVIDGWLTVGAGRRATDLFDSDG